MTVYLVGISIPSIEYSKIDLCVTIVTEVTFLIVKSTLYLEASIIITISLIRRKLLNVSIKLVDKYTSFNPVK